MITDPNKLLPRVHYKVLRGSAPFKKGMVVRRPLVNDTCLEYKAGNHIWFHEYLGSGAGIEVEVIKSSLAPAAQELNDLIALAQAAVNRIEQLTAKETA